MARPPKKTPPVRGRARAKSARAAAAGKATGRLDLQHALDPLAAALRSSLLRRHAAEQSPPMPPEPAAPKPKAKKALPRSPLAPKALPDLPPVAGADIAVTGLGTKYTGRPDLLVAQFAPGTAAAGVFTRSAAAAAPVAWCRDHLGKAGGEARLLVVNAGNANAFTGKAGMETVKAVGQAGAKDLKCRQREVFMASTGVIGEPLDPAPIVTALPGLLEAGQARPSSWSDAATAIMTTDTFPKAATATALIDDVPVTINGIAKGSGMIAPDMATMLAFLVTDAALPPDVLQTLLLLGTRDTFNTITVDSDTSTNDTVLAFATGQAGHAPVTRAGDKRLAAFRKAWHAVMHDLALQVVRDGEGATKLVRIDIKGAETTRAARMLGQAVANSPLVKTAIAGEDANWGRIVMALGKAGVAFDPVRLAIKIAGLPVAAKGARHPRYDEGALSRAMKEQEIAIEVDVGSGSAAATIWTCDLTHGYISINADYRS